MQTNSAVLLDSFKLSSLSFADDGNVDNDNDCDNDWLLLLALSGDSNNGGILCEWKIGVEYNCGKKFVDCCPNWGKFISGVFADEERFSSGTGHQWILKAVLQLQLN